MNDPLVIGAVVAAAIAALWAFWPIKPPPPPAAAPAPQFYQSPPPPPAIAADPADMVMEIMDAQARRERGREFIRSYTGQSVRELRRSSAEAYGDPPPVPSWYHGTGSPTPPPSSPN